MIAQNLPFKALMCRHCAVKVVSFFLPLLIVLKLPKNPYEIESLWSRRHHHHRRLPFNQLTALNGSSFKDVFNSRPDGAVVVTAGLFTISCRRNLFDQALR